MEKGTESLTKPRGVHTPIKVDKSKPDPFENKKTTAGTTTRTHGKGKK